MYVKLFSSIINSSVWTEDPATRIVWITMLLRADRDGFVQGVERSIQRDAAVTTEQCARALDILSTPDPTSQTPDHDGRRIEKVQGGWLVLNYAKYRELRTQEQVREANKKRRQRLNKKAADAEGGDVSPMSPAIPPIASASAFGSVVSSTLAEKFDGPEKTAYLGYSSNTTMDGIVARMAEQRGWKAVGTAILEMAAVGAHWTPRAFYGFLKRIPDTAQKPTYENRPAKRWCPDCEGPVMVSSEKGRLVPGHTPDCPTVNA